MTLSELIWFNSNIKFDSKPVYFFSDKNLNFNDQLFNDNRNIKPWDDIKIEFRLKDTQKTYWLQIIDALPKLRKDIILKRNAKKLVIFDHHIVRKSLICSLNKLTSKELYLILIVTNTVKPTTQDCFGYLFKSSDFNWKNVFLILNTNLDTKVPIFQYKVLHNTVYVNKIMLFKFGKVIYLRCSFCKLHEEIIIHLFCDCLIIKKI